MWVSEMSVVQPPAGTLRYLMNGEIGESKDRWVTNNECLEFITFLFFLQSQLKALNMTTSTSTSFWNCPKVRHKDQSIFILFLKRCVYPLNSHWCLSFRLVQLAVSVSVRGHPDLSDQVSQKGENILLKLILESCKLIPQHFA